MARQSKTQRNLTHGQVWAALDRLACGLGGKSVKKSSKALLGPASTGVEEDEVELNLEDVPAPPKTAPA